MPGGTKKTRKKLIATDKVENSVLPMTLPMADISTLFQDDDREIDLSSLSPELIQDLEEMTFHDKA